MKHLKIALGLVVMAALMAVAASPALATGPRWVQCREHAGGGQWEDNNCSKAKANGGWETKEVTETLETTSSGSLRLEDKKAGTAIKCSGNDTGTIGAGGTDSTKTITNIKCSFETGKNGSCEASKPVSAKPVNLPWSTRLEERAGGEVRDVLTSLTAGKVPGYTVECTVGGVFKVSDECSGVVSTGVKANRTEGSIETIFDKVSEEEPGNCTVGGEKQGIVSGTITISVLILFVLIKVWILIN